MLWGSVYIFFAVFGFNVIIAQGRSGHCSKSLTENTGAAESVHMFDEEDSPPNYTLEKMGLYYSDVYASQKRLERRAYFSNKKSSMVTAVSLYQAGKKISNHEVTLPQVFLNNIQSHISKSMENQYAQFLFNPDMGHGHIYIPDNIKINDLRLEEQYRIILNNKDVKILYHTAEELDTDVDDESRDFLIYRYNHRNIIGSNKDGSITVARSSDEQDTYNTVREIRGFTEWEFGLLYLRANKKGCITFNKIENLHFDLSI
ncbi:MAG: hypothetical protein HOO06_03290 [Bdellovibrionaceae bacterium]|nr:hypothetical protein [Pseudobdellovibrionaceae bacterium]